MSTAFSAPTDVPAIAEGRMLYGSARNAFQHPTSYAPFAPPPLSTMPIRLDFSCSRVIGRISQSGSSATRVVDSGNDRRDRRQWFLSPVSTLVGLKTL